MARTMTYLGKPGKPDTDTTGFEGIPATFVPNVPVTFDKTVYAGMGLSEKDGDALIDQTVDYANQNRPNNPLFRVTKTGASDSQTPTQSQSSGQDAAQLTVANAATTKIVKGGRRASKGDE